MKQSVIPLATGEVMFALGEDGAVGVWTVTPAVAREAADRLSAAGLCGGDRARLWPDQGGQVWFAGEPMALRRLADALRHGADVAEGGVAVKQ